MVTINDPTGIDPDAFRALGQEADRAGRRIADALAQSRTEGRKFEDVLKAIGVQLAGLAAQAAVRPLVSLVGGGLASLGGGLLAEAAPAAVSVTMNIASPDADSFRRSEAQVAAGLARAVERGQRGL